jgi:DNA-binding transcriptional LysR family regulator
MDAHLVVIVAPGDEWAAREWVALDALGERVLLTREPGSALHATIERLLGAAALAGDNVILLGETEAIKRSVEAGVGVALVQGIAVEREVAAGTLRALPLRGAEARRTYAYAQRIGRELSAAARDLVTLLEEEKRD